MIILLTYHLTIYSDLACHIDGFIASAAHTLVVGASKEQPIDGKKADALKAAYLSAEVALRLLKAGNKVIPLFTSFKHQTN